MRSKFRPKNQEPRGPNRSCYSSSELSPSHQPVQSPSPDKKSGNIITSTRSPEINELKQFHDRDRMVSSWHSQQEHPLQKPFPMSTPSKAEARQTLLKIQETQPSSHLQSDPRQFSPTSNSRTLNTRIEIVAQASPQEFDPRTHLSRIRDLNRSDSMELDYLKLLKSKQETIKELREIIEMIKKNNTSQQEVEDEDRGQQFRQRIGELKAEVKELKIENQHLLNVIEKNKKYSHPRTPVKDEILQREIQQLKTTIKEKELELQQAENDHNHQLQMLRQQLQKSQNQNESLIRILKEKEETLGNSSLSVQSKSSEKQKLTLTKIKDQYHQNLKLMKENFYGEIQKLQSAYQYQLQDLTGKLMQMGRKVAELEVFKNKIARKVPREQVKQEVREEYHKEKERHQEIQSLMLEKYSKYQNELSEHKKTNERLIVQLAKANKAIQEYHSKHSSTDIQLKIEELEALVGKEREENSQLTTQIHQFQQESQILRSKLQSLHQDKDETVAEFQKKIQLILMEYQSHSKEEKQGYESALTRFQSELYQSKLSSKQLIDTYERDKQDTEQKITQAIDLYNKQNETLRSKLSQKQQECIQIANQFQLFRKEYGAESKNRVNIEEIEKIGRECQALRVRGQHLEKEITSLNEELVEMDGNLKEKNEYILTLETKLNDLQEQKQIISKKHSESEIKNNDLTVRSSQKELQVIEINTKVEELQRAIAINQQKSTFRISSLQKQVSILQNQNKTLVVKTGDLNQEIEIKNNVIARLEGDVRQFNELKWTQNEPLEQELKELKEMIADFCTKISPSAQKEIVEEFYKLNYNFQAKLEENIKLTKDLEQIKTDLLDMNKQKQLLSEKITLLEQTNSIYERELKERRVLFDQLLQEKGRVEKEYLLAKKIKVEQNQVEQQQRGRIGEIEDRIGHLLEMQRLRNQNIRMMIGAGQQRQ